MSDDVRILGSEGNLANVNARGQVLSRAVVQSAIAEASLLGDAYAWTAVNADIDAGDTALLVANTSDSRNLVISRAYLWTDTACQIKVHLPAVVTWAGTALVGKNLNTAFGDAAAAIAKADESANVFVAANTIETVYSPVAVNAQVTTAFAAPIDFHDAVILGTNGAIAVDLITEVGAFEVTIVGYYVDR